jgi:hypothetical protein
MVNLVAVVLGFGCPYRTKRGEWIVTAALVDETIPLDTESNGEALHTINVNIFTKDRSSLPKIRYAGDVLRLHRVSKLIHL